MRTVKLSLGSENLLKELGSIIQAQGTTFYFMPYWFEKTDKEGEFIVHNLDKKLPSKLGDAIKDFNGAPHNLNFPFHLTPDETIKPEKL